MPTLAEVLPHVEALCPGFCAKIEGATPEQIEALQQEAERPLPEPHREFLRRMGVEPGPIFRLMAGMDTRVESLLGYYEQVGWRPPSRFTLIGRDPELPVSTFLDHQGDPPFSVVSFAIPLQAGKGEPWRTASVLAASLPELVMRCAFDTIACVRLPLEARITLQPVPDLLRRLDAALVGSGYERHPLTGGLTGMYWRGDHAAITTFHGDPHDAALVYLHTDDAAEAEALVERLRGSFVPELHWVADAAAVHPAVAALRKELGEGSHEDGDEDEDEDENGDENGNEAGDENGTEAGGPDENGNEAGGPDETGDETKAEAEGQAP
ncbi:MAG: SMI1/KNR4 family protein [Myxococcales bacterium]|nr:SMI1/KNR4 family protein [Myxococcales bacterium]